MPGTGAEQQKYESDLPQSIIESFARFLVPEIRKFYEREQGQREFTKWKEGHIDRPDS